jgi:hypothetical protein
MLNWDAADVVFNGDVYVAGWAYDYGLGRFVGTIWENGAVHQPLFDEKYPYGMMVMSIFVSDK